MSQMPETIDTPSLSDELNRLFVKIAPPAENTFELALVLGGTVSAGAYTAGALDFLFEALDIWTRKRDAGDADAPRHRVQIRVIAGTSGGGVCAAISARALAYEYPRISPGSSLDGPAGPPPGNPFYDVWCSMLGLDGFLDTADLQAGEAKSLLNGGPIDAASEHVAGFATDAVAKRSYLGEPLSCEPLRVILTVTNLHGIPYKTVFDGATDPPTLGESFVDHADHLRFAVAYPGQTVTQPRPDEMVLSFAPTPEARAGWSEFSCVARATAAFPVGFPARVVSRPMTDYRYRVAVLPADESGRIDARALTPDWDQLRIGGVLPDSCSFAAVDGGATDNEPIMLARTALCGVTSRNPRDALSANRAVLLIDPFSGETGLGVPPGDVMSVATGTIGTLKQQTRYDTADMLLAADPMVFSRFLIAANRDGLIGSKALATAGLGAFIGFACPAFMRHDYLLGRKNCQDMLRTRFGVDPANTVVAGCWTKQQQDVNSFVLGDQRYLRLIPLFGAAATDQTTDPWPVGALDPADFEDGIERRWRALLAAETSNSWWGAAKAWLGGLLTEGKVGAWVSKKMREDLAAWQLLPPDA
jgi:hypothetical protein